LRSSKTDVLGVQAPTYGDGPSNFLQVLVASRPDNFTTD